MYCQSNLREGRGLKNYHLESRLFSLTRLGKFHLKIVFIAGVIVDKNRGFDRTIGKGAFLSNVWLWGNTGSLTSADTYFQTSNIRVKNI